MTVVFACLFDMRLSETYRFIQTDKLLELNVSSFKIYICCFYSYSIYNVEQLFFAAAADLTMRMLITAANCC